MKRLCNNNFGAQMVFCFFKKSSILCNIFNSGDSLFGLLYHSLNKYIHYRTWCCFPSARILHSTKKSTFFQGMENSFSLNVIGKLFLLSANENFLFYIYL